MDSSTIEAVKKYWPWALGIIALLWLMNRNSGGSSGTDFYGAQVAAGQMAHQGALASQQLTAQTEAAARADALSRDALHIQGNASYMAAAAGMAESAGKSVQGILSALYAPSMVAMETAAYENGAVLNAAAMTAIGGFKAQSDMTTAASATTAAAAAGLRTWEGTAQGIGQMYGGPPVQSATGQIVGGVVRGATAYYTGGLSEAYRYM